MTCYIVDYKPKVLYIRHVNVLPSKPMWVYLFVLHRFHHRELLIEFSMWGFIYTSYPSFPSSFSYQSSKFILSLETAQRVRRLCCGSWHSYQLICHFAVPQKRQEQIKVTRKFLVTVEQMMTLIKSDIPYLAVILVWKNQKCR